MTPLNRDIRSTCQGFPGLWQNEGDGSNRLVIGQFMIHVGTPGAQSKSLLQVSAGMTEGRAGPLFMRELTRHAIATDENGKRTDYKGDPQVWLHDAVQQAITWAESRTPDHDGFDSDFWAD